MVSNGASHAAKGGNTCISVYVIYNHKNMRFSLMQRSKARKRFKEVCGDVN